ncbi:MAG: acetolactate synthase small subunit [Clostridia bacterium]|nr:acetolactate synthase small subunit [Clostridia bacterium]
MSTEIKEMLIAIRVQDQFGVLSRVASLVSRRGFNIDTLTVSATETPGISRMTLSLKGDEYTRKQLIKQLSKLHEVLEINQIDDNNSVTRDLLLIKIHTTSENRQDAMDAVNVFRGSIVDFARDSLVIQLAGDVGKINAFVELMKPFGIMEMCRTGLISLDRGNTCLKDSNMNYINRMDQQF